MVAQKRSKHNELVIKKNELLIKLFVETEVTSALKKYAQAAKQAVLPPEQLQRLRETARLQGSALNMKRAVGRQMLDRLQRPANRGGVAMVWAEGWRR